ncbi:MAG: hypothetical protein JJE44_03450 [Flavobacteriaceae bacterium]|nr:hypothetical protein [Flavobacteriaceae bacterium]
MPCLGGNKVTRVDDTILCINEAKNTAIALAKGRLFNDVNVQKSKLKWIGYFVPIP